MTPQQIRQYEIFDTVLAAWDGRDLCDELTGRSLSWIEEGLLAGYPECCIRQLVLDMLAIKTSRGCTRKWGSRGRSAQAYTSDVGGQWRCSIGCALTTAACSTGHAPARARLRSVTELPGEL